MRLMDADDIKYLYAAWKLGVTPLQAIVADTPEEFERQFTDHVVVRFHVAYTMIACPPNKEAMPVGVVFGIRPFYGERVMWIGDFIWFSWASKRNKLEAAVHFLNQMRKDTTILGFAEPSAIPFFEHICRYGVLRRAGTVFDMIGEGPRGVYQTRKPYIPGK